MGYYDVKLLSETNTIQDKRTVEKKVIKAGELIVNVEYLSIIKTNTNWY